MRSNGSFLSLAWLCGKQDMHSCYITSIMKYPLYIGMPEKKRFYWQRSLLLLHQVYLNIHALAHKQPCPYSCTIQNIALALVMHVESHPYAELKLAKFPTYLSLRGLVRFTECCLLMWRLTDGKSEYKTGAKKVRGSIFYKYLYVMARGAPQTFVYRLFC